MAKYNQETLQFENAIYRVLCEESNTIASFAKHPEFPEKNGFYMCNFGKWRHIKIKN